MLLETAPPPLSKLRLLTLSNKEDMTKGILTLALSFACTSAAPAGARKGSPREKVVESLWNSN
jgi:hypothetical protein